VPEGGAGDVGETFLRAGDGASEGVGRPCGAPEQFFDLLGGLFAVHGDFLGDDFAFPFHVVGEEAGVAVDIEEDVCEAREPFCGAAHEEAGMVFTGVGVHAAADAFDVAVELAGRAPACAFEEHVFGEVGETALIGGIVAAADAGPEADADAFHPRHFRDAECAAVVESDEAVTGHGRRAAAVARSPGSVILRFGEGFSTSWTGMPA